MLVLSTGKTPIDWLKGISNKEVHKFVLFDIKQFY